jgi:hypothetical protein
MNRYAWEFLGKFLSQCFSRECHALLGLGYETADLAASFAKNAVIVVY